SPLLWQHLFWFFGHPEVYIAILPAMGLCSQLLSVFSRKPIFGYRAMVYAILAIGFLGFMVWGHHMFMSGMSPYTAFAFSIMTMGIGVPSAIKTFNWLGTLWGGKIRFSSPMLFAIGFVSLFVVGGISGPFLAQPVLDIYLHETYFVIPQFITFAAFITIASQFIFVFNLFWSMKKGEKAADNPWEATTLEWTTATPPPHDNFGGITPVVHNGPYEYSVPGAPLDFVMQTDAPVAARH